MKEDSTTMVGTRPGSLNLTPDQPPRALEVVDQSHPYVGNHGNLAAAGLVRALCSSPVESVYDNLTDESPLKTVTEHSVLLENYDNAAAVCSKPTKVSSEEGEVLISSKNDVSSNSSSTSCIVSSSDSSCSIVDDVEPIVTVNVNPSSNSSRSWKCMLGNIANIDTVSSQIKSRFSQRLLNFNLLQIKYLSSYINDYLNASVKICFNILFGSNSG